MVRRPPKSTRTYTLLSYTTLFRSLGVVGGSGSGKSVLMNTILGLIAPSHGTIEIFQKKIGSRFDRTEINHRIGVMFQNGALFSSLSVQENRSEEHTSELQSLMRISYAAF